MCARTDFAKNVAGVVSNTRCAQVLTSFAAFGMDATAEALHYAVIQKVLRGGGGVGGFVALRVALTLLAVEATRVVSPIAAGSGIPEVKSVLAGFSLPGFLSLRTLVAKVGGVVLLLGAGLPIGKEGPFIHTAAILAESMLGLHYFRSHNATSGFRHQMLSAAAAVGVSAAFGAWRRRAGSLLARWSRLLRGVAAAASAS